MHKLGGMSTQTLVGEDVAARHVQSARRRAGTSGDLESKNAYEIEPGTVDPILAAVPMLETLTVATKNHPYVVIAGIVTAAVSVISAIVGAIVFVAIAGFQMYGTQQATLTRLETLLNQNTELRQEVLSMRKQQTDDMNAVRAYASNDARRTEFIVGLMTPTQQRAVSQFDRANPRLELPGVPTRREQQ